MSRSPFFENIRDEEMFALIDAINKALSEFPSGNGKTNISLPTEQGNMMLEVGLITTFPPYENGGSVVISCKGNVDLTGLVMHVDVYSETGDFGGYHGVPLKAGQTLGHYSAVYEEKGNADVLLARLEWVVPDDDDIIDLDEQLDDN